MDERIEQIQLRGSGMSLSLDNCRGWLCLQSAPSVPSVSAMRRCGGAAVRRERYLMWIHHGHIGIYGDDGEMQCGECSKFGCWDYKNAPIEAVRAAYQAAMLERSSAAHKGESKWRAR